MAFFFKINSYIINITSYRLNLCCIINILINSFVCFDKELNADV